MLFIFLLGLALVSIYGCIIALGKWKGKR